ncbi:MAG: hypothetical protein B7W99_01900, partial [Rhodospirillales bacterium 20-58-10]
VVRRLLLVVFAFALFEQDEKIGMFLREARAVVRASVKCFRDQDFQCVEIVDDDVAIADAPAAIVVFIVQIGMQRRPEGAGNLVGDSTQPPAMELIFVRDAAMLAEVTLTPFVGTVMMPVHF